MLNITATNTETLGYTNYQVKLGDKNLANYSLGEIPGCCGTCVIHYFKVNESYRTLPVEELNKVREEILQEILKDKHSNFIAQDFEGGYLEKLVTPLFTKLERFKNSNSGNIVSTFSFIKEKQRL